MKNVFDDDFTKRLKMRGSVWSLLVGLLAGIAAYIWGATHQNPEFKELFECERRELINPYDFRPTTRDAILAASAKCQEEWRSRRK